ncbi:MAG: hypothetical protein IJG83_06965 [Thermoguttaceae bacterium]|nr:hypothetical protein [Thermoguttaceae bacterium]MBQ3453406.1 hypothetical protein [Thermoguttaceae bacterium]
MKPIELPNHTPPEIKTKTERYKTIFKADGKWYTMTAAVCQNAEPHPKELKVIHFTYYPDRNGWKDRDIYFLSPDKDARAVIIGAWARWYQEEKYLQIDQRYSPCRPEDIEIPAALADNFKKF